MEQVYNSPGKFISVLHRYSQRYITKELEKLNIGSGQYIFLLCLYKKDGVSQECLSEALGIDKGTTARAISHLVKEGYLTREVDPEDRRLYRVFLTEQAISVKPQLRAVLLEWRDILLKGFSETEKDTALEILDKMAANVIGYFKSPEVEDESR